MSKFSINGSNYWLYRRAGCNYLSREDLGIEIEASKALKPIPKNTELSDFVLTL